MPRDLGVGGAGGDVADGVVELAGGDEVDGRRGAQRLLRQHHGVRADEADAHARAAPP